MSFIVRSTISASSVNCVASLHADPSERWNNFLEISNPGRRVALRHGTTVANML